MSVYDDIRAERTRQDAKWGGPSHDDDHDRWDWIGFVRKHATRAFAAVKRGELDDYRQHMVRVAALVVAAIESHDRRARP